ncbi:MAG: hypothetical protein JOZ89_09375, partial [Gammaproteobacteria bacterium]|nr:hypothetical protein [Gammaproteobacteria bacterium]
MRYVYHGVPKDMVGEIIYPLNQLRAVGPEAYELQRSKYAGREAAMDFRIPGLDLLLNDTVHCAALDPRRLLEARQRIALPIPATSTLSQPSWMTGRFFAIPLERVLQQRVVWYSCKTLWINGAPDEDVPL